MGNIVEAIEKEKEYLANRMVGKEPFHLVDAVRECGFQDLKDYFEAKRLYEISLLSFEIIETTPECAIADVMNTIAARKTAMLFAVTDKTLVWNGNGSTFNNHFCEVCGIPVYPLQTGGGTIVSTKGDLNIGICVPERMGMDARFILERLADIFRKHTDKTVEVSGNDVLVDGCKVLGSSTYNGNGMFMFITPVSFSDKTELIANICTKHSEKQPGHIDFMSSAALRQEVERMLSIAREV